MRIIAARTDFQVVARLVVVSVLLTVAGFNGTQAHADGWKLPTWNPFGEKKTAVENRRPPPRIAAVPRTRAPAPSGWSKFNSGVKDFFAKTGEALNPWSSKKPATRPSALTGNPTGRTGRSYSGVRMKKPEPEKKSIFTPLTTMFKPKPPKPRQPQSVTDFLNQPRPY